VIGHHDWNLILMRELQRSDRRSDQSNKIGRCHVSGADRSCL